MKKRPILIWLFSGCILIYAMVVIGGITRLTGSGLSITEWKPIMGALPPMNEQQWNDVFSKYQQSPQFQKVNFDFKLEEFKSIFWWEYIHRLLGRAIGMVFLLPFLYFLFTKHLSKKLVQQSVFIFLLGGVQGLLGWLMVKSGLINDPHVSHYRLAAHLITAFASFGFTFWVALELHFSNSKEEGKTNSDGHPMNRTLRIPALLFLGTVVLQIIYGAFVAGLHAGKIYNTFPMMEGTLIPSSVTAMEPFWRNAMENLAGVQFIHRMIAFILTGIGIWILYLINKQANVDLKRAGKVLFFVLIFQFTLGVLTLLYAVPVFLGVLHQSGAFMLFAASIFLYHRVTYALKN